MARVRQLGEMAEQQREGCAVQGKGGPKVTEAAGRQLARQPASERLTASLHQWVGVGEWGFLKSSEKCLLPSPAGTLQPWETRVCTWSTGPSALRAPRLISLLVPPALYPRPPKCRPKPVRTFPGPQKSHPGWSRFSVQISQQ